MLPNFDQKVTFGETKIKGLGREEEGEHSRLPAPLASIQKRGGDSVFLIQSPHLPQQPRLHEWHWSGL